MKLFDLHCDTLTKLRKRGETMADTAACQVSYPLAFGPFEDYTQVTAIWSEHEVDGEEAFARFDLTRDYAVGAMPPRPDFHPIYAVEGGKLLGYDLGRLDYLYERGVRILTLVWKDVCPVGGAYDTDEGLTDFGRRVVERCFDLGITPDLSHASDPMFWETAAVAGERGGTILVSHSCSRALCPHRRNLTDEMAGRVAMLDGVIGVNLVPDHLGGNRLADAVDHILHFASVAGSDRVALGCDFDGTDELPVELPNVGALPLLWDALAGKRGEDFADAVFYQNAARFAASHLKP